MRRDPPAFRRLPSLLLPLAAVVLIASLVMVGFAIGKNRSIGRSSCVAALDVRDAMVVVLDDARKRTEAAPARTPREQEQAVEFYQAAVATLRAVTCPR